MLPMPSKVSKLMESVYLHKGTEFYVFIKKRAGTYFKIRGRDGIAFAPGRYIDDHAAKAEMAKLRKEGFKRRVRAANS